MVEIVPKEKYSSADLNYSNDNCRANKEQNDAEARPAIKNTINIDGYDTIFIGYPIWWGTYPREINTFMDKYDISGKTVIPFCTSGGTGISESISDLEKALPNSNVIHGKKLSVSDVEFFVESLEL